MRDSPERAYRLRSTAPGTKPLRTSMFKECMDRREQEGEGESGLAS